MALRAKMRLDEAESAGFGCSKHKDDNEVWADFHPSDEDLSLGTPVFSPQPFGTGPIFPISSLLAPSTTVL
jgi:hypothetical protein